MKVRDLLGVCQNGIAFTIQETIYAAEGDYVSDVFIGEVGHFGRCDYLDCEIDYVRVVSNELEIHISYVKGDTNDK